MTKRKIVPLVVAVGVVCGGALLINRYSPTTIRKFLGITGDETREDASPIETGTAGVKPPPGDRSEQLADVRMERHVGIRELPTDILRLIQEQTQTIDGITPEDAGRELERREGGDVEDVPTDIQPGQLPFGILNLIATATTTVAGIDAHAAILEMVRLYSALKAHNPDDPRLRSMLEALRNALTANPLAAWARNEDREELEAFFTEVLPQLQSASPAAVKLPDPIEGASTTQAPGPSNPPLDALQQMEKNPMDNVNEDDAQDTMVDSAAKLTPK
ncbi:MAG: hypothetical protein LBJ69_00875 [Holosporales bacterium]|jgi:hypothetical protein|nr:hypothetical protein [Holosporales bacterium]